MRVTYYALKKVQVRDDIRLPGDLVPEARDWTYLNAQIREGLVAPVLVATLPVETQEMLAEWEADQEGRTVVPIERSSEPETVVPEEQRQPEPAAPKEGRAKSGAKTAAG